MAQIKHNHFLDTVDQVFTQAKQMNILHLNAEGKLFDGRHIEVAGKKLYHFGTTGYLGLEQDHRLKEAAKDAIDRYGTQYPLSKSYISHPLYKDLEALMAQIYERPVIITKNATLAHMAALPVLVGDGDTIILDHQVHWSVQDAAQRLKLRGVKIIPIRHNSMDYLEDRIKEYGSKSERIWYLADGVYSMYGDFAPIEKLKELTKKYKQLYLYFDDVHGMSWAGQWGRGYVFDQLGDVLPKSVVIGTLSKTFGANGSLIICGNADLHRKIKNFGGPLTFSAQLDPASVGAAIASAKIHLSPEIKTMQAELKEKIGYFNALLGKYNIPLVEINDSPVFFIATGIPETGYRLTQELLNLGFYVNMGLFPAVPSKNTGLRITLSRHNQKREIKSLAKALYELHPTIMQETHNDYMQLSRAFKLNFLPVKEKSKTQELLNIKILDSIQGLPKKRWDEKFKGQGILDWNGWNFVERVFQQNTQEENNWIFKYIQVQDTKGYVVLLAAFTISLWKEDILSPAEVSRAIEEKRIADPYYLTSKVLSLGSLFSDGQPMYVDREHPDANMAMTELLQALETLRMQYDVSRIVFRDFSPSPYFNAFFNRNGYIPVQMPETAIIDDLTWKEENQFIERLSNRSRKHFLKDIQPFQHKIIVHIAAHVESQLLQEFYTLYLHVKRRNLGLNVFDYPYALFQKINSSPHWEFIYLKAADRPDENVVLGVLFCYKNHQLTYVPSLIGMDYTYNQEYQVYRQLLYESIKRANQLNFKTLDFGISANFEKRKLGAKLLPKVAYMHSENNFMMDYLESQRGGGTWSR